MNKEIKSVGMVERSVYEKPELVMVSRNDNYSFLQMSGMKLL